MEQTPHKVFGITAAIIILAAVAFLGGGLWYVSSMRLAGSQPKPPQSAPLPSVLAAPSPQEAMDTSAWKTYRNEEYGFEVKYPPDWYYSGGRRVEKGGYVYHFTGY